MGDDVRSGSMKRSVHPWLPGVHPSQAAGDPELYDAENAAVDPERRLEAAMWRIAPWGDATVLDLGCGTGFHLPRFAEAARHAIGVEPEPGLRRRSMQRVLTLGLDNVSVLLGAAAAVPLADDSVDLVHARFAYFMGSDCDPGIAEVSRVLRPGGTFFVIENDYRRGLFAEWLRRSWFPDFDADADDAFWRDRRFDRTPVHSAWQFTTRSDLEAVVQMEFGPHAEALLAGHQGRTVDYRYRLLHRTEPPRSRRGPPAIAR